MRKLLVFALLAACCGFAADRKLKAVILDGLNNNDWANATAAIRTILEGSGRFTVDVCICAEVGQALPPANPVEVCTYPNLPDFSRYDVAINNFNGGHTETGTRWPPEAERASPR
jgi:hypothetical protein